MGHHRSACECHRAVSPPARGPRGLVGVAFGTPRRAGEPDQSSSASGRDVGPGHAVDGTGSVRSGGGPCRHDRRDRRRFRATGRGRGRQGAASGHRRAGRWRPGGRCDRCCRRSASRCLAHVTLEPRSAARRRGADRRGSTGARPFGGGPPPAGGRLSDREAALGGADTELRRPRRSNESSSTPPPRTSSTRCRASDPSRHRRFCSGVPTTVRSRPSTSSWRSRESVMRPSAISGPTSMCDGHA